MAALKRSRATELRLNTDMPNRTLVLVVEDDTDTRHMYAHWLANYGFDVAEARNGQEGVETAERVHPDVVLMDVAMPRMDGLEATRRLRRNPDTAGTPIVILSAYSTLQDRERAFAAGANDFLPKPCDLDTVAEKLQRYSGEFH
jgi:CheY-like chemotaxis protein